MGYVYFVQERAAGSYLIKIGATGYCPYISLSQLRNAHLRQSSGAVPACYLELLGSIAIPPQQDTYCQTVKHNIQSQFAMLRDHGDWFRPGLELVNYIQENAKPHLCRRSCPSTAIEEEMRAFDIEAGAAIQTVMRPDG